ncbi:MULTISPECIES: transcription elongation factor GreA [unclassified Rothia (in: high G+C Gram-positive bacteria)]|uniref:transcription elongation factor GreA n=1 Tax=unclassified Rothia (in: high G+C Gram-positive bacteria) TaxID=2689056 RepID=UPI00195ACEBC|nr:MULTISPECIES: transcription elongation factor GreA [unclassified Rothia (in: high G+C Gram-positive bacteria)]MBM7051446.1 transcription elongation factor GreA [Rothia sp. ZJ1223]QRZ61237.1 transcription elongation factor GreA [Rothia sp. ZJ932]
MSEEQHEGAWLTQEAYDRLTEELERISGPYRQEIIDRIAAARDEGDLKENGGYHAAREEQGKNEARINQLKKLLENAQVGESVKDDGIVEPGMVVEAELAGKTMKFLLGSREVAETLVGGSDLQVFSEKSPMGAAINGHKAGDSVTYEAPNGKEITVKIIDAKPFQG